MEQFSSVFEIKVLEVFHKKPAELEEKMAAKYLNENQEPSSSKNRRIEEEAEEEEDGALKITDLNDDCLEQIFGYLDLEDLLNIGQSNTKFQYAAGIAIKRTYGDEDEIELTVDGFESSTFSIEKKQLPRLIKNECAIPVFGDFISSIYIYFF